MKQRGIDVIIPVYNGALFIQEALDSVVAQTLAPERIIVVNDGSSDQTLEILQTYEKECPLPMTVISKENEGLSAARNTGIGASTAPYIAFLDADDVWLPHKLEEQIGLFADPKVGLVYCGYDLINKESEKTPGYIPPFDLTLRGEVFNKLLEENLILASASGALVRRSVFVTAGMFDENLRYSEDWDMWLRIAKEYRIDYVNEPLVHIRVHNESMTKDVLRGLIGEIEFQNKWSTTLETIPSVWRDRILTRLVRHPFNTTYRHTVKNRLTRDLYTHHFGKIPLLIHYPFFVVRKIFSKLF